MRYGKKLRDAACVAALAVASVAADEPSTQRPAPRVYTNEDLDRVSARRDETGVLSDAAQAEAAPREARETDADRAELAASERLWRREAEALRRRLLPLRERLASLRASIEASEGAADAVRRRPARQAARDAAESRVRSLRDRAAALEQRIRAEEMTLAERARRAGALPGWLR
jgi:chromosome segregation ATPase